MKRKSLSLLTLSSIALSSCSLFTPSKEQPIVVTHTKVVKSTILRCPKPTKPVYEPLDTNKPLTDTYNLRILLMNIAKMKNYCEELEETIKCYEDQLDLNNQTKSSEVSKDEQKSIQHNRNSSNQETAK